VNPAAVQSYYDVLGVEPTASREEIRHAYREAARVLHPDGHGRFPAAGAEERTRRLVAVTDAWRVLGDEDRRRLYDQVWQAAARRAQLVAGGLVVGSSAGAATGAGPRVSWAEYVTSRPPPPADGAVDGRLGQTGAAQQSPAPLRGQGSGHGKPRPSGGPWRPGVNGAAPGARAPRTGRLWRDRRADECRLCGSAPSVPVDLRCHRTGLLGAVYDGGATVERGPLCRSCGLAVLRELTDVALCGGIRSGRFGDGRAHRSLLRDVLSFGWLLNLLTVIGNLSFWFRIWRMQPPQRDPAVRAPLRGPLDPGLPLRERRGMAVLTAVAGVALAVVAGVLVAALLIHGRGP